MIKSFVVAGALFGLTFAVSADFKVVERCASSQEMVFDITNNGPASSVNVTVGKKDEDGKYVDVTPWFVIFGDGCIVNPGETLSVDLKSLNIDSQNTGEYIVTFFIDGCAKEYFISLKDLLDETNSRLGRLVNTNGIKKLVFRNSKNK
ncbi:MAG: hypothetical protein E7015_00290 [Alphaproteobacteria bacterium]|nr:hypothetical protein [Alphaproteobacteria bacterium]